MLVILGSLILPKFAFAQSELQTLRVEVIVKAKEIQMQKDFVQIPADNLPQKISGKKKIIKPVSKHLLSSNTPKPERNIVNNLKPKLAAPKQEVKISGNTNKSTQVVALEKKKTVSKQQQNVIATETKKPTPSTAKSSDATTTTQNVVASETTDENTSSASASSNELSNSVLDGQHDQSLQSSNQDLRDSATDSALDNQIQKNNQSTYFWIGIFLIVTGIVFGLLFGKIAFLISLAGLIFIIIGVLIR